MKVLQIIETAYRATIEEQDDTVVWITHAMKGAGAELDVLLTGNAVNYVVSGHDASGLAFGDWQQTQPPRLDGDVAGLADKGVRVIVLNEDLIEHGLDADAVPSDYQTVSRAELPALFENYDRVWHW